LGGTPTAPPPPPKHQAQLSPLYCGADAAEKYGTVRFVNQILLSRDSLKETAVEKEDSSVVTATLSAGDVAILQELL
jgi:hypothetical protein